MMKYRFIAGILAVAVSVSYITAVAEEQKWEDWLSDKIGTMAPDRADEIVEMLVALENEHSTVFAKHSEKPIPGIPVDTDAHVTQFGQALGKEMGCGVGTLEISYGGTKYLCETEGNISEGTLTVKLNDSLRARHNLVKTKVCEIMAAQTVNRNMVGADKPEDWHRRLNDVQAVCLGYGSALLQSVRSKRIVTDGGTRFNFETCTALSPVDIAWTMGAVALLRKQDMPDLKFDDVAATVAFKRGIDSVSVNERRMKMLVKAAFIAMESGNDVVKPRNLPKWDAVVDAAVPEAKSDVKRILDYWTRVPSDDEMSKGESGDAKRLLSLRDNFNRLIGKKSFAEASELFLDLCLSDGADFALATVCNANRTGDKVSAKSGNSNFDNVRWLSLIDAVAEARNYLRTNEDLLSGKEANFYHHAEAAQRFAVLGDKKRTLDEIAKIDTQSGRIVEVMRSGRGSVIPSSDYVSNLRKIDGYPPEPEFTIAEYWWNLAKGKRKRVMDYYLSLSAEWYGKAYRARRYSSKSPEWYRIATKRASWTPSSGELNVDFDSELKTAGVSGIMIPTFVDSKDVPISRMASRTVTWTNQKREVTRKEVFYQPKEYWEHKAFVAGWMDYSGNELRMFRVKGLPLRDEEFDETIENCPTKAHLDARLQASEDSMEFDNASLAFWASRFFGMEITEQSLKSVPCGKLSKALVVTTGDLSFGGIFLRTYNKEWYFLEMRLTGCVSDIGKMLGRLAIKSKTISWKRSSGAPIAKEDGMLIYSTDGYVIKVDMVQSLASTFVSRMGPMLQGAQVAFRAYIPPRHEMKKSELLVFNNREKYDSYVNTATDRLENRSIGMWIASKEKLYVYSGMKKVNDDIGEETFRTLRHEAFHQYLFYATGHKMNALWYNEGHACFFETAEYSASSRKLLPVDGRRKNRFAKANGKDEMRWPRMVNDSPEEIAELMPLIVTMSHEEFYHGDLDIVNKRYAAAWALIYFLEKGIKVMKGYGRYEGVLPTYLEVIQKDGADWKEASEKAWAKIDTKRLVRDFLAFWNDEKARKLARAFMPKN